MPTAYINIGSNMGNREAVIGLAIAHIEFFCKTKARLSEMIETSAWGFKSASKFLNQGLLIETEIAPMELLRGLQEIERKISSSPHRNEKGEYIDRVIDIDLIAIDDVVIDTGELQLPHPRMHLRDFVLVPMVQLAPGWRHPLLLKTSQELLDLLCRDEAANRYTSS